LLEEPEYETDAAAALARLARGQKATFGGALGLSADNHGAIVFVDDEKLVPADFVFAGDVRLKLFAIQYKALYGGNPDFWPVDATQHRNAQLYPWVYYGLSELSTVTEARGALHALRIARPRDVKPPRCTKTDLQSTGHALYSRWWAFYQMLITCHAGTLVTDEASFLNAFAPILEYLDQIIEVGEMLDIFLLDLERQSAVRMSTWLRTLPAPPEQ